MPDEIRVNHEKLTKFAAAVLEKLGAPREDAELTARILVAADLRGVESHGVAHLKMFYVRRIRLGIINLRPQPKIVHQTQTTATMDGDQGLGFVIGHHAMAEAIRRAQQYGSGFVAVRNSTHFGAGAYYAMMALPHDMIGISMTSTIPGVVPPGASLRAVGTNPIAVAIPAGRKPPFVLDMATSVVAAGKIEVALRKGTSIPEGWAIDREGKPITDPTKRSRDNGGLLPLGGDPQHGAYKGYGLGVWVDIMSSVLSGAVAPLLRTVQPGTEGNAGDHFFGALRVDGFTPVDQFKQGMDDLAEAHESLPALSGFGRIRLPGGPEADLEQDRLKNGIPLYSAVITSLQELATELNLEYSL